MTNNSHREVTTNSMALYTCFTLFLYCATAKLVIPTKAQVGKYNFSHTRFEERVELEYYISRLGIGLLVPKHSFALRQEPPGSDLIRYTIINISSLSIIKSQNILTIFRIYYALQLIIVVSFKFVARKMSMAFPTHVLTPILRIWQDARILCFVRTCV